MLCVYDSLKDEGISFADPATASDPDLKMLYEYWKRLRRPDGDAHYIDLDFSTLPRRLLPWIYLLEVERGETIDYACAIYATAPFVDAAILRHGFDIIRKAGTDYAFSVTSFPAPIMRAFRIGTNGRLEAYFPKDLEKHSQHFAEAYHDAGQFYWGRPRAFAGTAAERLAATAPIILPRHRVQDIDTEEDWLRAEYLYRAWTELGQHCRATAAPSRRTASTPMRGASHDASGFSPKAHATIAAGRFAPAACENM